MSPKLRQFFVKSFVILLVIHIAYFLYGYFTFEGISNIDIYTEFYRFKFYDDVSISHFFVSGIFLFFFLIFLILNHSRQRYSTTSFFKISLLLLVVSFATFSFFISYSFGMNAKLKTELPEAAFNKDKSLLNILNPFLYKYTSYTSDKLFNVINILYPKPYPVIEQTDSIKISDDNYITESTYYSIDTLKVRTVDLDKISGKTSALLDSIGFDKEALNERIIAKQIVKDSTIIIFKGEEVNPKYDEDICVFLQNNSLFQPLNKIPADKQKYTAAVKRHQLIYTYGKDSMLYYFKRLDTLLKKYNVESQIIPSQLASDVQYYRANNGEPLNAIRNNFDRNALSEKFTILDRLFYKPQYLHDSIIKYYFGVIFSIWMVLMLIYGLFSYKNKRTADSQL